MGGDIKITGKLNDDYMLSVIFTVVIAMISKFLLETVRR